MLIQRPEKLTHTNCSKQNKTHTDNQSINQSMGWWSHVHHKTHFEQEKQFSSTYTCWRALSSRGRRLWFSACHFLLQGQRRGATREFPAEAKREMLWHCWRCHAWPVTGTVGTWGASCRWYCWSPPACGALERLPCPRRNYSVVPSTVHCKKINGKKPI